MTFLAVVIGSIGLLAAAIATGPLADAWHTVVIVDGETINRTELRARMTLDAALLEQREAVLRTLEASGSITQQDADRVHRDIQAAASDRLRAAIDGLVADRLILEGASSRDLTVAPDVALELHDALTANLAVRVRAITIQLPTEAPLEEGAATEPPSLGASAASIIDHLTAATEQAHANLAAGMAPDAVAADLTEVGWRATAWDTWLPRSGPVAGLPDALVAAARARTSAGPLEPIVDPVMAIGATGVVTGDQAVTTDAAVLEGVDDGAFRRWAEARAAERALRAVFSNDWRTIPQPLIRVREIVVGSADVEGAEGEYRSFAHLVVGQLPADELGGRTVDEAAAALATELGSLGAPQRVARFEALVEAANKVASDDPLRVSGEMAYFTKDGLLPEVAQLAFREDIHSGDVVGPVSTSVGPEIFLVRGTFHGQLDERSIAALVEARTTTDVVSLAARIAPVGEWIRATGTLWRSQAELVGAEDSEAAYASTPIQTVSDPFVLQDEIVVVVPLERGSRIPDEDGLARLEVRGFDAWLAGKVAAADVARDPEPLPGVLVQTPMPSSPDGAIPTPNLPSLPLP